MAGVIATNEQRQIRILLCESCPDKKEHALGISVCGLCRCPISSKSLLTHSNCPADKWPKLA